MTAEGLLQQATQLGATFKILESCRLEISAPSPLPCGLMEELRRHKGELLTYLGRYQGELPFPLGYGGLPEAQVVAAEAVIDGFGIADPILRKYNVLAWVRGYYQDIGKNQGEFYQAIKAEQGRLGEILNGKG